MGAIYKCDYRETPQNKPCQAQASRMPVVQFEGIGLYACQEHTSLLRHQAADLLKSYADGSPT